MTMTTQQPQQPKDRKRKQLKSKWTASNSCKYQPTTAPIDCNSNNKQLQEPTTKVNKQSTNCKQQRGSSMQS